MGIGPRLHQRPDHLWHSCQHSVVERHVPVAGGRLAIHQFWPDPQDAPHLLDVADAHRFDKAADRDSIDEGLQLGPTVETITPRKHELRVVQRKARLVGITVEPAHFRGGVRSALEEANQQFFGLTPELF